MKLKDEFVTVVNSDGAVTVSTDTELFSGMIRSNQTAAYIISCLENNVTEEEIAKKLAQEYNVNPSEVFDDVKEIIEKLRSIGAIDE